MCVRQFLTQGSRELFASAVARCTCPRVSFVSLIQPQARTHEPPDAEDWSKAQIDFFESFKSYDEAGSPQRIQVLKYLVLAHMLMDSAINPFDSQETKPCVSQPTHGRLPT